MSSARGNRLYNGKAKLAHTRQRAEEAYVQEQIDGYFEWASRRRGSHPKLRIVRRSFQPLAGEDPNVTLLNWEAGGARRAQVSAPGDQAVAGREATPALAVTVPADESSKPAEPASPPGRPRRHVEPPDKPIRVLRPMPLERPGRWRERRLSYSRLAYGFLWGSAAALAVLWLVDLAMM
jgi:hypothetical protein